MSKNDAVAARNFVSDVTKHGDRAETLRTEFAAKVQTVRDDERLSDKYKQEQIGKLRNEYAQQANELRSRVENGKQSVSNAAHTLKKPQGDANQQMLTETRQNRAWDRTWPQLDNGRSWQSLLREAEKAGDTATVQAIANELPAYLEANRSSSNHDQTTPDRGNVNRALRSALARSLGDDGGPGTAARFQTQSEAHTPVVEAQLDRLDREVAGGRSSMGDAVGKRYAEQARDKALAELDQTPDDTTDDTST